MPIIAAVATAGVPRKAVLDGFTPASSRPAPTPIHVVAIVVAAVVAVITPRVVVSS
jgi:hypothetical protein